MVSVSPEMPLGTPLTEGIRDRSGRPQGPPGMITEPWIQWLSGQTTTLDAAPERKALVALTEQSASIGATAFDLGGIGGGLYRLTFYAQITTAAGTSSSLTLTFGWTAGGISLTASGAALTGNSTTTVGSATTMVFSDALSPITYSTTYASSGVPAMQYAAYFLVEQVGA